MKKLYNYFRDVVDEEMLDFEEYSRLSRVIIRTVLWVFAVPVGMIVGAIEVFKRRI